MSVLLLAPALVLANADVCPQPDDYSRLSLAYYEQDKADIGANEGQLQRDSREVDLQFVMNDTWSFGINHHYVILDTEPMELQTNGHLHTLSFPLHRQSGSDGKGFRFSVAPALSASSNVMKDTGEFSSDTFQILVAMVWSRELAGHADLRYGICADHRFGDYTVYPSLSLDWRPHPDWRFELGFPVTRMTYRASSSIKASLRVAPDGNEWHVKSKDRERQSQLVYKALQVRWSLEWRATESLGLTVGIARVFRSRYDVVLADGSGMNLAQDTATRVGASLEWRF